jgi:hypothetical protein
LTARHFYQVSQLIARTFLTYLRLIAQTLLYWITNGTWFLLSFLESVPDVDAKLKAPNTKDEKFEDVVKSAQDAAVLVC